MKNKNYIKMKKNIIDKKCLYCTYNKDKNRKLVKNFIFKRFYFNNNTLALVHSFYSFQLIIIFFLIIFIPIHLSFNIQFRHLNYDNKITIIIEVDQY